MIRIPIVSDYNNKGVKQAQDGVKSLDASIKNMGKSIVAGFAVGQVFQFGKAAVNAAVDLNESVNAVNVTFGEASDSVLKLSEDAATAVGLSSAQFNSLAVQLSAFAKQVTPVGASVADTIDTMTQRAADFASVMNISVEDAVGVFQSTLAGSSEVARQYGIDVSAAAVEQYILANGIADSKAEITEADKVLGRYALLMESTGQTAGDFANTSDSLANQQRILQAELANVSAEIGESLIPALSGLADVTLTVIDALEQLGVLDVIAEFGQLEKHSTNLGRSLRRAFDAVADANFDKLEEIELADRIFQDFDRTLLGNARTVEEISAIVNDYTANSLTANEVLYLSNRLFIEHTKTLREQDDAYRDARLSVSFLTEEEYRAAKAVEEHRRRVEEATADFDRYETAMNDARIELQLLTGQIDDRQAWLNLQDSLDDTFEKLDGGTLSAREQEQAMIDLKLEVLRYGEQMETIPAEKLTDILALIDNGSLAEAERQLEWLTRSREVGFEIRLPDQSSWANALGLVAETGGFGNVSMAGRGATTTTAQQTININVTPGQGDPYATGLAVADGLTAYQSNNGYIRNIFG